MLCGFAVQRTAAQRGSGSDGAELGTQRRTERLDGHSDLRFARQLKDHLSVHKEYTQVTKDMYRRIGQYEDTADTPAQPASVRIQANMAAPADCAGKDCEVYKFISEKLMPAALQEVSRRFKITRPAQNPLKISRHCKRMLDTGNCAEVHSPPGWHN